MRLIDKYAPSTIDEIIGQERAINQVKTILKRPGFSGDALWIVGPSGTGKTSLAQVIAKMYASDLYIYDLDGEACTVDAVRSTTARTAYRPFDGRYHVIIVNEAQAMTQRAVQAWLTYLDRMPEKVLVIFTTTDDSESIFGQYDSPFMSRCKQINYTNQGLAQSFAERAQEIARAENMDGQPIGEYMKLVRKCKNNFRAVLQQIEAGVMIK